MNIGDKLRSLRLLRGITAEDLAVKANLSRSYITNIENGRKTDVTISTLTSLATALGIKPMYFLDEEAMLPTDAIPNLPPDIVEILVRSDAMPFLKLTDHATKNGVSVETVSAVIQAIIDTQKKKKSASD